ncbi:MAG: hypothetical protein K6F92_10345 [Lachnospiraceae bacterium]|nr:hypothetical protein [Lachnospiraceae bacterium]
MREGSTPYNAYVRLTRGASVENAWPDGAVSCGGGLIRSSSVITHRGLKFLKLGLCRALNEVYCLGAEPFLVTVDIAYPEKYSEEKLKTVMEELVDIARDEGVSLTFGALTGICADIPVITFGALAHADELRLKAKPEGQTILMAGYVGDAGSSILAQELREELSEKVHSDILEEAAANYSFSLKALRNIHAFVKPVSEGGVLKSLWEIKENVRVGYNISLRDMCIRQECVEVCEALDVNPYQLAGDGAAIIITDDPDSIASQITDAGFPVNVIGQVSADLKGLFFRGLEGSYVDRPAQDELYRFMRGVK